MDINYEGLCNLLDGLGPGVDIIQKHLLVDDWNKNVSDLTFCIFKLELRVNLRISSRSMRLP